MIILQYWNERLQIGLKDWKTVYQFPQQIAMQPTVYQGSLYYRLKGNSKRISYQQIKKGLQKKRVTIEETPLPF